MPSRKKQKCIHCGRITTRVHPILDLSICLDCQLANREDYQYITKSRAKGEYRLNEYDLNALKYYDFKSRDAGHAMKLYLLPQIKDLAKKKWGTPETYIVSLINFSDDYIQWILEDLKRLIELPPDKFQYFVANRLEKMGLRPHLVGNCYRKDGGIDIIAIPDPSIQVFPFLLGVQCKHHRSITKKTPVGDVRDLNGVIESSNLPFHMGMIVTNTGFTPDALWFAKHNRKLLRLRDLSDLRRWLRDDYTNEYEWREIPDEIELAPGITIPIAKPYIGSQDEENFK